MIHVAGVDEVGRGCLAGPVVAASVILPKDCSIEGINDSKKLSPLKREKLFDLIIEGALAYGVGLVWPQGHAGGRCRAMLSGDEVKEAASRGERGRIFNTDCGGDFVKHWSPCHRPRE